MKTEPFPQELVERGFSEEPNYSMGSDKVRYALYHQQVGRNIDQQQIYIAHVTTEDDDVWFIDVINADPISPIKYAFNATAQPRNRKSFENLIDTIDGILLSSEK